MTNFGIYLINKPKGITSHDVVDYLRKITSEKTIGHAGTLDPLASGLMIVAIGREFTKRLSEFSKLDKTYIAEATLGATSTTYDTEGAIIPSCYPESFCVIPDSIGNPGLFPRHPEFISGSPEKILKPASPYASQGGRVQNEGTGEPKLEAVKEILQSFVGKHEQLPPIFSAKKIKGQKAYDLARRGQAVELKPVTVEIDQIKLLDYSYPIVKFSTKVSSGTYIRSLVHDIGQKLNTGAFMSGLIRNSIGEYKLSQAIDLYQIKSSADLHPHQLPLSKGESRGGL